MLIASRRVRVPCRARSRRVWVPCRGARSRTSRPSRQVVFDVAFFPLDLVRSLPSREYGGPHPQFTLPICPLAWGNGHLKPSAAGVTEACVGANIIVHIGLFKCVVVYVCGAATLAVAARPQSALVGVDFGEAIYVNWF